MDYYLSNFRQDEPKFPSVVAGALEEVINGHLTFTRTSKLRRKVFG